MKNIVWVLLLSTNLCLPTLEVVGQQVRFETTPAIPSSTNEGAAETITYELDLINGLAPAGGFVVTFEVSGTLNSNEYTITGATNVPANSNDYTLTLPEGANGGSFTVTIIDDPVDEPDEDLVITLTGSNVNTTNNRDEHTLTVEDDDPPPIITISGSTTSGNEGDNGSTDITITLTRNLNSARTFQVNIGTGGTAGGADFALNGLDVGNTLEFNSSDGLSKTFTLRINGNNDPENNRTVVLTIESGTNYQVGTTSQFTYTILDDDSPPAFLVAGDVFVEGNNANLLVNFPDGADQASEEVAFVALPPGQSSYDFSVMGEGSDESDTDTRTNVFKYRPFEGDQIRVTVNFSDGKTTITGTITIVRSDRVLNLPDEICQITQRQSESGNTCANETYDITIVAGVVSDVDNASVLLNGSALPRNENEFLLDPSELDLAPNQVYNLEVRENGILVANQDFFLRGSISPFIFSLSNGQEFCSDDTPAALLGLPFGGEFYIDDTLVTEDQIFDPGMVSLGDHTIRYLYTQGGCCSETELDVTVIASPVVDVTVAEACLGDLTQFTATPTGGASPANWEWIWDFGDGRASEKQNPAHRYLASGAFDINLIVRDLDNGCTFLFSDQININPRPEPIFTFENLCVNDPVIFIDSSTVDIGNITSSTIDFGDGQDTSYMSGPEMIPHIYNQPGAYRVSLTVRTDDCDSTVTKLVNVFPTIRNFPNTENFNQSSGGWFPGDTVSVSWRHGFPNAPRLANLNDSLWITDLNLANSEISYANQEQSYIESPCYDFGSLRRPMLSLDYWVDTDPRADGVVILYNTDNTETGEWKVLGRVDGTTRRVLDGKNWYNSEGIIGNPDLPRGSANTFNVGWSGQDTTGTSAAYDLDQIVADLASQSDQVVRFRMAFGSNDGNVIESPNGFAFDNFTVSERDRLVVMEHFTNSRFLASSEALQAETQALENIVQDGTSTNTVDIRYHVNFPENEDTDLIFNQDNRGEVSARALQYGVAELPRTVIDGLSDPDLRPLADWGVAFQNQRTLARPLFDVEVLPELGESNSELAAHLKILRRDTASIAEPLVLQLAVVQVQVRDTFNNVVRKLIPNAAGAFRFTREDLDSLSLDTTIAWSPYLTLEVGNFFLLAFLQGEDSKEIYQADSALINFTIESSSNRFQHPKGNLDLAALEESDLLVFPNPSHRVVHLAFSGKINQPISWQLYNAQGMVSKKGQISEGYAKFRLDLNSLEAGVYSLRVGKIFKKIILLP